MQVEGLLDMVLGTVAKARPGVSFLFWPLQAGRIERAMIARMWHATVPNEKTHPYRDFVLARAIPDLRSIPGNLDVQILERREAAVVHFVTLTLWENLGAVREFVGPDEMLAKYYAEDQDFLLEFESRAKHLDVVGEAH
jgi:heme-degrading monooxygenase HmoA